MGFGGGDFFGGPLSLGQFGYMAEAEGQDDLVNTFDAKFNAALRDMKPLAEYPSFMDVSEEVNEILANHGIDYRELTAGQVRRIQDTIA